MYTFNVTVTPQTTRSEIEQLITILQSMIVHPLNQATTIEFSTYQGFGKIRGIKILRELTGLGLPETKSQVDGNLFCINENENKWKWVIKPPYDLHQVADILVKSYGCNILRVY